jgi:hypothetical protein
VEGAEGGETGDGDEAILDGGAVGRPSSAAAAAEVGRSGRVARRGSLGPRCWAGVCGGRKRGRTTAGVNPEGRGTARQTGPFHGDRPTGF